VSNTDPHNGLNKTAITIIISIGAVVMVALIVTLFVIKKLRKKIAIMRDFQNGKHAAGLHVR